MKVGDRLLCTHCGEDTGREWRHGDPRSTLCDRCYYTVPNLWNSEKCRDLPNVCTHMRRPEPAEVEVEAYFAGVELPPWRWAGAMSCEGAFVGGVRCHECGGVFAVYQPPVGRTTQYYTGDWVGAGFAKVMYHGTRFNRCRGSGAYVRIDEVKPMRYGAGGRRLLLG